MVEPGKKVCPECKGKGKVAGQCVCDSEWRGSQQGEEWQDCACARDETCPLCRGKGVVDEASDM
jgi:RecJ-like exonuclease